MWNHPHQQNWLPKDKRQQPGFQISPWQYTLDKEGLPLFRPVARHEGCFHVFSTPHSPFRGHGERCEWAVDGEGHLCATMCERLQQVHTTYSFMFYAL